MIRCNGNLSLPEKSYKVLSKDLTELTYLFGYLFEIEARQFNNVSQFKYGAQWRIRWMIKAGFDVLFINVLHQVTPENTFGHYKTQNSK